MTYEALSINKDLLDILGCPFCHSNITLKERILECSNPKCTKHFEVINGVPQMNVYESSLDHSSPRIRSTQRLLQLSFRLGRDSFWLIPAMRKRSKDQLRKWILKGHNNTLHCFTEGWDFELALQERIAKFIDLLVTPHELADVFILQWKGNLKKLLDRTFKKQTEFKKTEIIPPQFLPNGLDEREQLIKESLPKGKKLLYVGCGTGRECFRYEKMGYDIVGIDTEAGLLDAMQNWCLMLNMQVKPVQMNVLFLGFLPHTFDAAIIEIYGGFPSKAQRLKLQQELARVLKPGAFALIVGMRFHYTKYMQLQNMWADRPGRHLYLEILEKDLLQPSFKEPDGDYDKNSDRLIYGISRGTYSCESLSTELSACFQIHRCWRAQDKRYLLTLVRPLPQGKWSITEVEELKTVSPTKQDISKANVFAQELESFIEILEENAEATKEFIDQSVRLEDKGWNMLRDLLWKE